MGDEIPDQSSIVHHNRDPNSIFGCGYYGALMQFLEHTVSENFLQDRHRDMIVVEDSPDILLDRFAHYQPPKGSKWVD